MMMMMMVLVSYAVFTAWCLEGDTACGVAWLRAGSGLGFFGVSGLSALAKKLLF